MNVPLAFVRRAALAGLVIASVGRVGAESVRLEGVSFDLPEGWGALEPEGDGPLPFGISAMERRDGTAGAWARSSGSGIEASLIVEVHPRATEVRRDLLPAEKQAIERVLRAAPDISGFRLLDHRVVEIQGRPAYRIRGRVEIGGFAVEQLQFVLSGSETVILTFSWEDGHGSEEDCDAIARSARIDRRAGFFTEGGGGGLAAVLGLLAGMALASRRLARSRGAERPAGWGRGPANALRPPLS